jgi:hypothetical protein
VIYFHRDEIEVLYQKDSRLEKIGRYYAEQEAVCIKNKNELLVLRSPEERYTDLMVATAVNFRVRWRKTMERIRHPRRFLPALFVVLAFASTPLVPGEAARSPDVHRHRNGLRITIPDGFAVRETATGFDVREEGAIRTPGEIRISLIEGPPDDPPFRRRLVGRRLVRYRVQEVGTGSGGGIYQLSASVRFKDSFAVVTALEQREFGRPTFDAAWEIIRSVVLFETR